MIGATRLPNFPNQRHGGCCRINVQAGGATGDNDQVAQSDHSADCGFQVRGAIDNYDICINGTHLSRPGLREPLLIRI